LLNEVLGRSSCWAPRIFGTAAPDTGNAEILAYYGTEEQKAAYLQPLLDGDIVSAYSMTEPQGPRSTPSTRLGPPEIVKPRAAEGLGLLSRLVLMEYCQFVGTWL
jgi:hypothetical protein